MEELSTKEELEFIRHYNIGLKLHAILSAFNVNASRAAQLDGTYYDWVKCMIISMRANYDLHR